jgi:5-methylcytosine-specific restriction protein B
VRLPAHGLTAKFYVDTLRSVGEDGKSFPEVSLAAWGVENERLRQIAEAQEAKYRAWGGISYWLVGAHWDDRDPADQTQRFLEEGIWENGYKNRYINDVMAMQVNDKIAIKTASTQRAGLPFDAHNKTVSRMTIKAVGTIVANRGDGKTVEVEWDPDFEEKSWYFYTNRGTIWRLRLDESYRFQEYAEKLKDFVWYGKEQDYDWFLNHQLNANETDQVLSEFIEVTKPPYSIDDMLASGVFLTKEELEQIIERLQSKKAMILQGPPGVGKTFI